MITDQEFDARMQDLFGQLAERIPTSGDPRSVLDGRLDRASLSNLDDRGRGGARRGRWLAAVAAASVVVVGAAALATREGASRRIVPAAPTNDVSSSLPVSASIEPTSTTDTAPSTVPAISVSVQTSIPAVPLDPYGDVATMLQAAQDLSYRAMVKAVSDCMLAQGYTYQSVPDPGSSFFVDTLTRHPWTRPAAELVTSRGYLVPGQGEPVVNPDGDTGFGNAAYQHALYGDVIENWELSPGETVPDGFAVGGPVMDGCRPIAQTQLVGDGDPRAAFRINDYFIQMQNVEVRATMEITSRSDYENAVSSWSTCMQDHGFEYSDPEQPRRAAWASPRPGAAEIAAAAQDVACKNESGLTEVGSRLFDRLVADWFAQHPNSFAEITAFINGVNDRADAILAS